MATVSRQSIPPSLLAAYGAVLTAPGTHAGLTPRIGLKATVRQAQTPAAIIQKLNTELNATLNDPVVRDKLRVLGIEATPGSPEAFRDEIRRDLGRYGPVVKAAGIQVE